MTKDANDLAKDYEIRQRQAERDENHHPRPKVGTFSVWNHNRDYMAGNDPILQTHGTLDLSKPGLIVAYDDNGDAEIWAVTPGMVFNFVPDRHEGE